MKRRVVVAMSGGVDSSTAALILVRQGYEVIGISMRFISEEVFDTHCCGINGVDDARGVAYKLGIPFYAINYEEKFREDVIEYFFKEYIDGRTPNPCIICNEKIKFGTLLNRAKELGADYIATGHYAKIEYDDSYKRWLLKKGKDTKRDQSYYLFSLSQEELSHSILPLGDYTKDEVRRLAREFGLKVHNKPASQGVCFIPDNDYRRFIKRQIPHKLKSGPIIDSNGRVLARHQGIAFYTIGQRRGIGAYGRPYYVISINKERNAITIGEEELYRKALIAEDINWIVEDGYKRPLKAKIRYRQEESEIVIHPIANNMADIRFIRPQRAITPGQAIVFYDNDIVLGGGWIKEVLG